MEKEKRSSSRPPLFPRLPRAKRMRKSHRINH